MSVAPKSLREHSKVHHTLREGLKRTSHWPSPPPMMFAVTLTGQRETRIFFVEGGHAWGFGGEEEVAKALSSNCRR